jgi:hypothetical protein
MELLVLPFGLISIPATAWCIRHWPSEPPSQAAPASAAVPAIQDGDSGNV